MSYNYIGGVVNNPGERCKNIAPWIWWDDAFNDEELNTICELSSQNLEESKVFVPNEENLKIHKSETVTDVRVSQTSFNEINQDNSWIFERLNNVINTINYRYYNFDLNGYQMYQYAEYNSDRLGKYDFHMDTQMIDLSQPEMRKLSITLLLNEPGVDFEGGEFEFMRSTPDNLENVEFKKGRIIVFPSFLLHRVKPVTKGIRKSLVVWVLGPKFR